jgi:hypothetical protein
MRVFEKIKPNIENEREREREHTIFEVVSSFYERHFRDGPHILITWQTCIPLVSFHLVG